MNIEKNLMMVGLIYFQMRGIHRVILIYVIFTIIGGISGEACYFSLYTDRTYYIGTLNDDGAKFEGSGGVSLSEIPFIKGTNWEVNTSLPDFDGKLFYLSIKYSNAKTPKIVWINELRMVPTSNNSYFSICCEEWPPKASMGYAAFEGFTTFNDRIDFKVTDAKMKTKIDYSYNVSLWGDKFRIITDNGSFVVNNMDNVNLCTKWKYPKGSTFSAFFQAGRGTVISPPDYRDLELDGTLTVQGLSGTLVSNGMIYTGYEFSISSNNLEFNTISEPETDMHTSHPWEIEIKADRATVKELGMPFSGRGILTMVIILSLLLVGFGQFRKALTDQTTSFLEKQIGHWRLSGIFLIILITGVIFIFIISRVSDIGLQLILIFIALIVVACVKIYTHKKNSAPRAIGVYGQYPATPNTVYNKYPYGTYYQSTVPFCKFCNSPMPKTTSICPVCKGQN